MVEPHFLPPHDTSHNITFTFDTFLYSSRRKSFLFPPVWVVSHGFLQDLLAYLCGKSTLCYASLKTSLWSFLLSQLLCVFNDLLFHTQHLCSRPEEFGHIIATEPFKSNFSSVFSSQSSRSKDFKRALLYDFLFVWVFFFLQFPVLYFQLHNTINI